jgi:hypothetical protein
MVRMCPYWIASAISPPVRRATCQASTYAAGPGKFVEQLRNDQAIQAADTLMISVPSELGVDYNVYLIDSVLRHVAPALGWR